MRRTWAGSIYSAPVKPDNHAPARDKILFYLKTKGPQTAATVARRLGVTPMAVRQHLYDLEKDSLVAWEDRRAPVGRPARHWALTSRVSGIFPDSHAELIVGLLDAVRSTFGEAGLERLIETRLQSQAATYRDRLPGPRAPLDKRIASLVSLRKEEGYMAEWTRDGDGSFMLIENHCPICDAAKTCQRICGGELDLFRQALGKSVKVERTEHMMEGARRCVYRIAKS
ncbi:MAG: transcriptional regulator [Planctomycetes bacterium]|nr:transcriptional regulator [Planctomycetota bacterium]